MVLVRRPTLHVSDVGSVGTEVRIEGSLPYRQPTHPTVISLCRSRSLCSLLSFYSVDRHSVAQSTCTPFQARLQGTHSRVCVDLAASVQLLCMPLK